MQPADGIIFGSEGLEQLFGIIGLNPRAQEPRGHRQMGEVADDLFEFEPGEPGREHVLAHCRAQPGAHAQPYLLGIHNHSFPSVSPVSFVVRVGARLWSGLPPGSAIRSRDRIHYVSLFVSTCRLPRRPPLFPVSSR